MYDINRLDSMKQICIKIDTAHTPINQKPSGVIRKADLVKTLRNFFPVKSVDDFSAVEEALSKHFPGKEVNYKKLFAEDFSGDQGEFIEVVRDQHLREIQYYIVSLEKKITHKDFKGSNELMLMEIREAFQEVDPHISDNDLICHLNRALGRDEVNQKIVWSQTVDYNLLIKAMKKGLLKPTGNWNGNAQLVFTVRQNKTMQRKSTMRISYAHHRLSGSVVGDDLITQLHRNMSFMSTNGENATMKNNESLNKPLRKLMSRTASMMYKRNV